MDSNQRIHSCTRRGSSLAVAMVVLAAVVAVVMISGQGAVSTLAESRKGAYKISTTAALEAVLARREQMVIDIANQGDPTQFVRWSAFFNGLTPQKYGANPENYGVDFFGDCEVRWKIEPVVTPRDGGIGFISNPAPSTSYTPASPEVVNDIIYLFRVTAEARMLDGPAGNVMARAVGVRYASVNKQPLFRYVIFYAQEGAKGDLELSHSGDVTVRGNVHSNGAIYLGSSTLANTFASRVALSSTTIGPDASNHPVTVTGVDGLFCLSKQLMYGAMNGYPCDSAPGGYTTGAVTATSSSTWRDNAYSTAGVQFPGENTLPAPSGSHADAFTGGGRYVNPYRVKAASQFVTYAASDKRFINKSVPPTPWPTATAIPIRGQDIDSLNRANDSRDAERAVKWNPNALEAGSTTEPGFNGYARSKVTNGRIVKLPSSLAFRPFEPQLVTYIDKDGDGSTDDHEWAQPNFLTSSGQKTTAFPTGTSAAVVEAPGQYLSYAIGSAQLFHRRTYDGSGWVVTTAAGTAASQQPSKVGLVIRERLVPASDLWPGTRNINLVAATSPLYMPYAYGKHWRPTSMPFTPIDVTDHDIYSSTNAWTRWSTSASDRTESYANGSLTIRTSQAAGPSSFTDNNITQYPSFYRENWKFVHLKQTSSATTAGMVANYWNNLAVPTLSSGTTGDRGTHIGAPIYATTVANPNGSWSASPGGTVASTYWGLRWEGFLTPGYTESYTFSAVYNSDEYIRVWVNGVLVIAVPAPTPAPTAAIQLQANVPVPIVIEHTNGSTAAATCQVKWTSTSTPLAVIPASALTQRADGYGFPKSAAAAGSFQAVQAQIDTASLLGTAPTQAKYGLMVRDSGGGGLSPLGNGADCYVAACYSPQRGFFLQRRLQPSSFSTTAASYAPYFIGNGTYTPGPVAVNTAGEAMAAPASQTRSAVLVPGTWATASSGPTSGTSISAGYRSTTAYTINGNTTTSYPTGSTSLTSVSGAPSISYPSTVTWIPLGDGTYLDKVQYGQVAMSISRTPQARAGSQYSTATRTGTLPMTLSGNVAGGVFLASDNMNNLVIHAATTGATALSGWTSNLASRTYVSGTSIQLNYSATNTNTNDSGGNTYVAWTSSNLGSQPTSQNFGSSTTIWNTPVRRNAANTANANPQPTATEAAAYFTAYMNNGSTYQHYTTQAVTAPSWSTTTLTPTGKTFDTGYPTNSLALTTATVPTLTNPITGSYTFSLNRTVSNTANFHLNSFISAYGKWFDTGNAAWTTTPTTANTSQYLPWYAGWTGTAQIYPPKTGSFRPDLWKLSTAPTGVPPTATLNSAANITTAYGAASTPVTTTPVVNGVRWTDDQGTVPVAAGNNVFLRLEKSVVSGRTYIKALYYVGTSQNPAPADFTAILDSTGAAALTDISNFNEQLLVGPAVQSGSQTVAVECRFANLKVETAAGTIDQSTWDGAGSTNDLSRYLASQYQVLWGIYDITEDFFSYNQGAASSATAAYQRLATEDWIYNPREFWSQGSKWDDGTLKDSVSTTVTNRMLWGKTTLLTLNMASIQEYMKNRTLTQAVATPISGLTPPTIPSAADGALASRFNGLYYACRANRYPWNPNASAPNPYSGNINQTLPNSYSAANSVSLSSTSMTASAVVATVGAASVHKLQPYSGLTAQAIKPQNFHHAVRIKNASKIDIGYAATPKFGESKISIVTPNQLFVQGDVNTVTTSATVNGTATAKYTPVAVMGDVVTLLSNSFADSAFQTGGLTVSGSGYGGTGILATSCGTVANSTTYNMSIVTHNAPTTRLTTREGQAAPFIDTMQFLEDWTGKTMTFKGSLVVMDSRRYTQAFLLDAAKSYGRCMMGTMGWHAQTTWGGTGTADWTGSTPAVYAQPTRNLDFNDDLLSAEGTPPFTPYGVTASGVGGWAY